MATTLRELGRTAVGLGLCLFALNARAQAQVTVPGQAAPSAGAAVTPTLGVQVSHTDNAAQTTQDKRQSDTIVSVTPGLLVQYRSTHSTVTGQMQLSSVTYLGNTQPDRILPTGLLALRSHLAEEGVGLDASIAAEQVKPQFTSATAASTSTSDTYTNTRIRISPFFERPLSAQTTVRARLERTQVQSSANNCTLNSRPSTDATAASAGWSHRGSRISYNLDARYENAQSNGALQSLNTQRSIKGSAMYALTTELEMGPVLGRESNDILQQHVRDTIKGVQLAWRPSERTALRALVEERFFGRSWNADFSQSSPTHSFGVNTSKQLSNYTNGTGPGLSAGGSTQALLDAMLSTRIPNEADRATAVNDLIARRNLPQQLGSSRDLYDLNTLVRQNLALRGAIMGVRSVALVSMGQARTRPLSGDAFSSLLGAGNDTRERYIDTQLNHRLTPLSTVTMGLRLGRARAFNQFTGTATSSRDVGMRLSLSSMLSPRTQAVCGLRRQRTVGGASGQTITENVVFAGLEHRF